MTCPFPQSAIADPISLVPFVPMSQGPTRIRSCGKFLSLRVRKGNLHGGILNADLADQADLGGVLENIWAFL